MEKEHGKHYHSKKILGKLYDAVQRVAFEPNYDGKFDERILNAGFEPSSETLNFVKELKAEYDIAVEQLMRQYEIKTEFEVWTTFALQHSKATKDFKFHEEIGPLSHALKDRFRKAVYDKAGGQDFHQLAPFAVAMYMVTQQQMEAALTECRATKTVGGKEVPVREQKPASMPLISFPWLLQKILGDIATGRFERSASHPTNVGVPCGALAIDTTAEANADGLHSSNGNPLSHPALAIKGGDQILTVADNIRKAPAPAADLLGDIGEVSNGAEMDHWLEEQGLRALEHSATTISAHLEAGRSGYSTPGSTVLTPDSPTYLLPYDPTEKRELFQSPVLKTARHQPPSGHLRNISAASASEATLLGRRGSKVSQISETPSVESSKSKSRIEALLDECDRATTHRRASRYSLQGCESLAMTSAQEVVQPLEYTESGNGKVSWSGQTKPMAPLSIRTNEKASANGSVAQPAEQIVIDHGKKRGPSALELLATKYGGF